MKKLFLITAIFNTGLLFSSNFEEREEIKRLFYEGKVAFFTCNFPEKSNCDSFGYKVFDICGIVKTDDTTCPIDKRKGIQIRVGNIESHDNGDDIAYCTPLDENSTFQEQSSTIDDLLRGIPRKIKEIDKDRPVDRRYAMKEFGRFMYHYMNELRISRSVELEGSVWYCSYERPQANNVVRSVVSAALHNTSSAIPTPAINPLQARPSDINRAGGGASAAPGDDSSHTTKYTLSQRQMTILSCITSKNDIYPEIDYFDVSVHWLNNCKKRYNERNSFHRDAKVILESRDDIKKKLENLVVAQKAEKLRRSSLCCNDDNDDDGFPEAASVILGSNDDINKKLENLVLAQRKTLTNTQQSSCCIVQ